MIFYLALLYYLSHQLLSKIILYLIFILLIQKLSLKNLQIILDISL